MNVNNFLIISTNNDVLDPKTGDQIRIYNLSAQLKKNNNNIIILEPKKFLKIKKKYQFKVKGFTEYTPQYLTDLNIFFYYKIYSIIKNENINLIQIAFPGGIFATKIIIKLLRSHIPIIYDAHNVEGNRIKKAKLANLPFYKRIGAPFFIPLIEGIAVKLADYIISVSHKDKELFIKKYNVISEKVAIIPSGTNITNLKSLKDINEVRGEFDIKPEELIVVFHGAYTYYPNKEAIDLTIDYIAPKIEELFNNVKFIVAGKDVPRLEKKNIKFVGFVEDLDSLLSASDIAIVPLIRGGGTKLKIFDYMGAGLPIVTTKKGIEGINAKNGEHAIIVNDVNEEFIDALKYLIDTEKERERIGANARKLAEEEYDWDKIGEKLDKIYRRILEEKKHANK